MYKNSILEKWDKACIYNAQGQPTPLFLLGNLMDREASWATVHGVLKELDTT